MARSASQLSKRTEVCVRARPAAEDQQKVADFYGYRDEDRAGHSSLSIVISIMLIISISKRCVRDLLV